MAQRFSNVGFQVLATKGTAAYFEKCGIKAKVVPEVGQAKEDIVYYLAHNKIQLLINTLGESRSNHSDGYIIRQNAVLNSVPLYTSLDTANAILKVLEKRFISVNPL